MPWNFDTKQFDPPLSLVEILALPNARDQVFHFEDFVFYKSSQLKLPLTRHELMFRDAAGLFSEIVSDGWESPFGQIYTWDQFGDIMEVLHFCGHSSAAALIADARNVYYLGRSDLKTWEERLEAGMDGLHMSPDEQTKFYDIGDAFERLEVSIYPDLVRWPIFHLDQFPDLARQT
jgi:hypothetical protein